LDRNRATAAQPDLLGRRHRQLAVQEEVQHTAQEEVAGILAGILAGSFAEGNSVEADHVDRPAGRRVLEAAQSVRGQGSRTAAEEDIDLRQEAVLDLEGRPDRTWAGHRAGQLVLEEHLGEHLDLAEGIHKAVVAETDMAAVVEGADIAVADPTAADQAAEAVPSLEEEDRPCSVLEPENFCRDDATGFRKVPRGC
jgi:hypothetical protein